MLIKKGRYDIPMPSYTLDSFLEDLADNANEIFATDEDKRTVIKVYLMTATDDWLSLFSSYGPIKHGEMFHFKMPFGDNDDVDYYVHEIEKGLLMFFTASKREDYNKTLRNFVRHHQGINNMWLPPYSFEEVINYVKGHHDATIYSFTAKRSWSSKYQSEIRPDFSRLIHYSGDDAGMSLKEFRKQYGVLPTLVDFKIDSEKMRITNEGLFLIRNTNRKLLRIIQEVVDQVLAEQRRIRNVSRKVDYTNRYLQLGDRKIDTSSITAGKIVFNKNLTAPLLDQLFSKFQDPEFGRSEEEEEYSDFSFIDPNVNENGLSYSATIIDEDKGTIFGLSGDENNMILVPKHRITYESFINFYRFVNESIDESSVLHLFSEQIAR